MFREMRRFKQSLSNEKIIDILKTEKRATLSVNGDDGYPYGIPVNFNYDEEKNKISHRGRATRILLDFLKK